MVQVSTTRFDRSKGLSTFIFLNIVESQHVQAVFNSLPSASHRQRRKAQLQHFHAQICLFHDGWNNIFGVVVLGKDSRQLEDFHREVERSREELCVAVASIGCLNEIASSQQTVQTNFLNVSSHRCLSLIKVQNYTISTYLILYRSN